jgi:hypothetical protein
VSTPDRAAVAEQQAALLRAVLSDGPAPAGFSARMLGVERAALLAKRRRVNALLDPDTAADLGEDYRRVYDGYAAAHPRRDGVRARADAAAFRAWAVERGHLAPPPKPGLIGRLFRRRG